MEHGPTGEEPPDHNSEPDVPSNDGIVEPLPSRGRGQARGRGRGSGRPRGGGRNASSSAKRLMQHSFNRRVVKMFQF